MELGDAPEPVNGRPQSQGEAPSTFIPTYQPSVPGSQPFPHKFILLGFPIAIPLEPPHSHLSGETQQGKNQHPKKTALKQNQVVAGEPVETANRNYFWSHWC